MLITGLFAGILGLFYMWLSMRVMRARRIYNVPLGDGGHEVLALRIRAHSNFVEYVPFTLFLMLMNEVQGMPAALLYGIGVVLIVARILHAVGLLRPVPILREVGMVMTFGVIGVASALLIFQFFMPSPVLQEF